MMTYLLRHCLSYCLVLFVAALLTLQPAQAQTVTEPETDEIEERALATIDVLPSLLELRQSIEDQITAQIDLEAGENGDEASPELLRLRHELQEIEEQISIAMSGVSERDYQSLDQYDFDLNSEVQDLIEPFVLIVNEATSGARQLERARRDQTAAEKRIENALIAIGNIEAALAISTEPTVQELLNANLSIWRERYELHQAQAQALAQRINDLQSNRTTVGGNVNSAFEVFFRDRSISLFLGIGAFLGVLALGRILMLAAHFILTRRVAERTFAMRLGGVLFSIAILIGSFVAMLAVFNIRNDWLLLGLAMLLFIAALWLMLRMLPNLVEQLWVLLNLGAVQERERVLFNGVPYRVERLSFFTDLVNPALDGGEFTLPVRELVGMHSRPAAEDEAWFPSIKGDWVRLADGNAGQIIAQTPEMVVLELLGGARVTYQTAEYLSATPENLSHGYRVEIEFGIGYRHQKTSTNEVITQMRDGIRQHFESYLPEGELTGVDVEFLRAGASSLDYEVEIDIAGTSAHRFEALERELARCVVDLATQYDWEIPFAQLVVHTSGDKSP